MDHTQPRPAADAEGPRHPARGSVANPRRVRVDADGRPITAGAGAPRPA